MPEVKIHPVLALFAGACVIGFAPILVRLGGAGPVAVGFWRLTFALPLMAPFVFRAGAAPSDKPPDRLVLTAGVFFAFDLAFWHYGIRYTSVANATVLSNLTPVVVTALGWALFGERPRRLFVLGVAFGLAGAWLMASAHGGATAVGQNPALGDLLSLGTCLWYSGYFLIVRRARARRGAMSIMFWSSAVAAVLMGAISLALGETLLPASLLGWLACGGLALIHIAGQGTLAWALGRLPAATASVVVLIQPVVAAALGWFIFREALGPWQALGGVVALLGVALAQWSASATSAKAQAFNSAGPASG